MRRTTAFSFASMLLTGVAATALMSPSANAQHYQQYGQSEPSQAQFQQYGQNHGQGQQPGPRLSYGQGGRPQFSQFDQGGQMQMGMGMHHGQNQQRSRQFGPEPFDPSSRYQQYGARDQYGFPPFDPNDRALHYGSREQYGFPPFRADGQGYGRHYAQPQYGWGQDGFARDYRGPQGFDQYPLGQQRSFQGQIQDRERAFQERFGPDSAYHQLGPLDRMPQPSMWDQGPDELQARNDQGRDVVSQPGQILVTSASDLVGRTVRDLGGDRAGKVEYIMIDALSGDVSYAILGAGKGLDIGADYVAVPWSAVVVRPGDEQDLVVNVSRDRLMQAPRLSEDELADLTNPTLLAHVTNFYAVPEGQDGQAQGGQDQQQQSSTARNQQQTEGQQAQNQQAQQDASQPAMPDGDTGQPAMLVGRRVVTMLHPPALVSPTGLRGTRVFAPNGWPIGSIDQVMLDLERGHVAFVLLASGGFLGMDQDWTPVPFRSLEWVQEARSYVLAADPRQLLAMPELPPERLPVTVSARDLAMLHAQFGVMPYWQPPTTVTAQFGEGGTTNEGQISPDEVREMLHRQGFTEISELARDGGTYEVTATRGDRAYDLEIDARTGIIENSRMTSQGVRAMLERQGYSDISDLSRTGNTYSATAQAGDRQVELQIDARTGAVQTESGS